MSCSNSSSMGTVSCPINSNTFPGKLWKLVNGGRFQSIGWSNGGSCIAINGTTFKNEVLYNDEFSVFKTQNFSSFVRQLNLYGFRKLAAVSSKDSMSGEDIHHFQNPYFNRNRPELLGHVRRASSRRRGGSENAENSYYTTTPYRFGPGCSSKGYPQTLFHHQGVTYAPIKHASHSEPLQDINNRFNPYYRPNSFGFGPAGQQCFSRGWGAGGGVQGLTLVANTASGSLTATCPSEPRLVDFPSLYNQQGQLRKFVVIQEDIGHVFQGSNGAGFSLPRRDNLLLSNSCDPMMCAVPQPSPPQQAPPQTFILSPPQALQSQVLTQYPGTSGPAFQSTPPQIASCQGVPPPDERSSPKVYTELLPMTSAKKCDSNLLANKVATTLPITASCGSIGALSNINNNKVPSLSAT
ncbi:transcription factor SKN7-like [Patiria miniata]|uniref:HSF-type DNA-binding domain-containing protein n=1 Tax=Patiria miniata TaxID=46514 RepID=A0A914B207_PATMI|nr:transcription factor SKN7-like [Patiria miniata]